VLLTRVKACDQRCFTISEVAAVWHELMIPQRTMRPSIALDIVQLDPWFADSRHATVQSATLGLHLVPRKLYYSFPFPPRVGGWIVLTWRSISWITVQRFCAFHNIWIFVERYLIVMRANDQNYTRKRLLLCGRRNRLHYESCPPVRPSVRLSVT